MTAIENRDDRVALTIETTPAWMGGIEDLHATLPDRRRMPIRALAHSGQGRFTIEAEGHLGGGDWFSIRLDSAWAVIEVREP
ncbi:hypothetical protein A0130_03210 [Leifsonia xyli]|nr:hypothetical protein A0130_03210 [Leifsonia xyli]